MDSVGLYRVPLFYSLINLEQPMHLTTSYTVSSQAARSKAPLFSKVLLRIGVMVAVLCALTGWAARQTPAVNLGSGDHFTKAGLLQSWRNGDIVVLVRHAERCDRSNNPCLGKASGITVLGSSVAAEVGAGFKHMGLDHTDIYSSPLTRTVQTSSAMFGKVVATQDWLGTCQPTLRHQLLTHKTAGRNLLLVTHSSCINELEKELNVSGASYDSQYASALFVSIDKASGKSRLVGYLSADDWAAVEKKVGI